MFVSCFVKCLINETDQKGNLFCLHIIEKVPCMKEKTWDQLSETCNQLNSPHKQRFARAKGACVNIYASNYVRCDRDYE